MHALTLLALPPARTGEEFTKSTQNYRWPRASCAAFETRQVMHPNFAIAASGPRQFI